MLNLSNPVTAIHGVGQKTKQALAKYNIHTVADLLLYLPLRYDDRSQITTIDQLQIGETVTLKAKLVKINDVYRRGRKMTFATIADDTGQTKCIWFNNKFISKQLKPDKSYFFSGEYSKYKSLTQPTVEKVSADTVHTGRLVPIYSSRLPIAQGTLRRMLKNAVDELTAKKDQVLKINSDLDLPNLTSALKELHFPEAEENVKQARQRLALEELLALIQKSEKIKQEWQAKSQAKSLNLDNTELIPEDLPFSLTADQHTATQEILQDLQQPHAMNRLLVGDVGCGKTVVAGIACYHSQKQSFNTCLIAPTQILAQQHTESLQEIFPQLNIQLLTAENSAEIAQELQNKKLTKPQLFIGTHAVINQLNLIQPSLIIYDEQHRFGVKQRSEGQNLNLDYQPHLLTMTATPIPRSYMLTIFSHLQASFIKEFPFGPKKIKSWLVPKPKRNKAYTWLAAELSKKPDELAIIICPFINPSDHEAFKNIKSATEVYENLQQQLAQIEQLGSANLNIALLHGQQKKQKQEKIIQQLFNKKINLLVTTTIVEVGVDLPNANYIVIESAERFGLASLHQLRGRVGRKGQQSYCLLFSQTNNQDTQKRLENFSQTLDGFKLAELDLENRGGGDLFGVQQHGFDELKFASWSNAELITQAHQTHQKLKKLNYQSILFKNSEKKLTPVAN